MKIAVQVYSVRDAINDEASLLKALEKIKEIGYDGVEFAGYFGASAQTIRAKLDELGLVCVGGHIGLDDFAPEKLQEAGLEVRFSNDARPEECLAKIKDHIRRRHGESL